MDILKHPAIQAAIERATKDAIDRVVKERAEREAAFKIELLAKFEQMIDRKLATLSEKREKYQTGSPQAALLMEYYSGVVKS